MVYMDYKSKPRKDVADLDKPIYAGEWKLMECLWEHSPQTLMELVKTLAAETGWAKSTVTTMVTRMEAKGLLRFEQQGRAKQIWPAVSRSEASAAETEGLVNKVFRGSPGLLMAALIESKSLSPEEINELYDLLKKAEEERHA